MSEGKKSLFVFNRDLHLNDNVGLIKCLKDSSVVHLLFIFDYSQASSEKNPYFSLSAFNFMISSLKYLTTKVHINFVYEKDANMALESVLKEFNITDLWENEDGSPFARVRQLIHETIAQKHNISYHLTSSISINPLTDNSFLNKSGKPYVKFTPFYQNAISKPVPKPQQITTSLLKKISRRTCKKNIKLSIFGTINSNGGRNNGMACLKSALDKINKYDKLRDFPILENTSKMGPHLQFNTISVREVYWFVKEHVHGSGAKEFLKQLWWREFYLFISCHVTKDYNKKSWTLDKYNKIKWRNDSRGLEKWKNGKTGVPIVDAGMRQLLKENYMHNRLRMITAMYLVHYLGIHWKYGEQWFAVNLKDYCYANNYGGWTWCASTEIWSNPSFRVFSMEQQQKRFDPEGDYVKKWCPEYKTYSKKDLYNIYSKENNIFKRRLQLN